MKYFLFVIVFALVNMAACQPAKKAKKTKEPAVFDVVTLKRGPCRGKCPVYEVQFRSDNKMVYKGENHMPLTGHFEYVLPPQLIKNLVFEAKKAGIQKLPGELPYVPDVPGVELSVIIDGKKKTIKGEGFMPENMKEYVKMLHEEVSAMIVEQEGIPLKP